MRLRHHALALLLLVAPVPALGADPVDPATRSSARQLGEEGNQLFNRGDYAGALDKYQRAAALVNVPTLGVRIARCLEKLGRLVEASERYLAVTRMPLPAEARELHEEAKQQAATERAALLKRIPSVVVTPKGPGDVQVTIDGKPLEKPLYGAKRAIDPGSHRIEARRGDEVQTKDVTIAEGETSKVDFEFGPEPQAAPGEPVPSSGATPAATPSDQPGESGSTQRTLGYVSLGVGALGLAVGAGAGLIALGEKSDLESSCGSDLQCPPASHDDANGYNRLRTISTVGFVVGGIGAAAGITLLLTAPSSGPATGGEVAIRVSGNRLDLLGRF